MEDIADTLAIIGMVVAIVISIIIYIIFIADGIKKRQNKIIIRNKVILDIIFLIIFEIFKFIKEKNEGDFIVIGDRYVDIEIAKVHNLFSIGCSYGFGTIDELEDANIIIDNIKDLSKVLSIKY